MLQKEVWPQVSGEPMKCVPKEIVVTIRQVVEGPTGFQSKSVGDG